MAFDWVLKYGKAHAAQPCQKYPFRTGFAQTQPKRQSGPWSHQTAHVYPIYGPRRDPRGETPHVNRQGGQELEKIITPKKYLRSAKNTNSSNCGEIGVAR